MKKLVEATRVPDRWSPAFALISGLAIAVFIWAIINDSGLWHFAMFILLVSLGTVGGVWFIISLFKRRPRNAASVLVGVGFIAISLYTLPFVKQAMEDRTSRARLPEFEKLVADQRARMDVSTPVRIVVDFQDRSEFVVPNVFEYIIYDETDEVKSNPNSLKGFWPYPKSNSGVVDVGGVIDVGIHSKSVRKIGRHFYKVLEIF